MAAAGTPDVRHRLFAQVLAQVLAVPHRVLPPRSSASRPAAAISTGCSSVPSIRPSGTTGLSAADRADEQRHLAEVQLGHDDRVGLAVHTSLTSASGNGHSVSSSSTTGTHAFGAQLVDGCPRGARGNPVGDEDQRCVLELGRRLVCVMRSASASSRSDHATQQSLARATVGSLRVTRFIMGQTRSP